MARSDGKAPHEILEAMRRKYGSVYNDRELHVFLFDRASEGARREHRIGFVAFTGLLLLDAAFRVTAVALGVATPNSLFRALIGVYVAAEAWKGKREFVLGGMAWHAIWAFFTLLQAGANTGPYTYPLLALHGSVVAAGGHLLRRIWPMLTLSGQYRGAPIEAPSPDAPMHEAPEA